MEQAVVVVEIAAAEAEGKDPLLEQLGEGVLDQIGGAIIGEVGGELVKDMEPGFDLISKESPGLGMGSPL